MKIEEAKPMCEKSVRHSGKNTRCKNEATHTAKDGRNLCELHYNQWVEKTTQPKKLKHDHYADESESNNQYDPYENNYDEGWDSL